MKGQHTNSRQSYVEAIASGLIESDSDRIVECMLTEPPLTARQIAARLSWPDVYKVRRRMSELVKDGVCVEFGSVPDEITGRPVGVYRLANEDDDRIRLQNERIAEVSVEPDDSVVMKREELERLVEVARDAQEDSINVYHANYFSRGNPLQRHVDGMEILQGDMDFIKQIGQRYLGEGEW